MALSASDMEIVFSVCRVEKKGVGLILVIELLKLVLGVIPLSQGASLFPNAPVVSQINKNAGFLREVLRGWKDPHPS